MYVIFVSFYSSAVTGYVPHFPLAVPFFHGLNYNYSRHRTGILRQRAPFRPRDHVAQGRYPSPHCTGAVGAQHFYNDIGYIFQYDAAY